MVPRAAPRPLLALTLALALPALTGCQRRDRPGGPAPGAAAAPGGARAEGGRAQTLAIYLEAEPAHLLPMIRPDFWAKRITSHNILESLVRIHPRTLAVVGELAERWEVSADGKVYTFALRRGVRWHDGAPFSAADVAFTLDRLLDEGVNATSARAALQPFLQRYEVLDGGRLRLTCKVASPFFLPALGDLDILPRHLLAGRDLNTHPFARRPLGTGPYRFAAWQAGQQIELRRFGGYWGEAPAIARQVYRLVSSPDLAIKLARRGELDLIPRVRAAQWEGVVQQDAVLRRDFVQLRYFPPGFSFLMLQHEQARFRDPRVRKALAMLLDLDTILARVMGGIGQRVGSLYWFRDPHYDASIPLVPYDPPGALRLLREAGYGDSDGDGVLDRGGQPLRLTFLVASVSKSQQRWATLYQQALRRAGIEMAIRSLEWQVFIDRLGKRQFDMAALGMRQSGPHTDLFSQLHSSQIEGGQNYSAYRSPEADRLLEAVRTEMDDGRRRELARELQRLLARDVALIPLFAEEEPGLVSRRVKGVQVSPLWYPLRTWSLR